MKALLVLVTTVFALLSPLHADILQLTATGPSFVGVITFDNTTPLIDDVPDNSYYANFGENSSETLTVSGVAYTAADPNISFQNGNPGAIFIGGDLTNTPGGLYTTIGIRPTTETFNSNSLLNIQAMDLSPAPSNSYFGLTFFYPAGKEIGGVVTSVSIIDLSAPEPSTWALVAGGLVLLAFWRLRASRV